MTEKEIIKNLIEQSKVIIGSGETIIINYEYDSEFDMFYITTAKPMTNIIWRRKFDVDKNGKLHFRDSSLANFYYGV